MAAARKRSLKDQEAVPTTLPEFVTTFRTMFGKKNYDATDVTIAAHFQEEIGEVADDVNRLHNQALLRSALDSAPDHRWTTHADLEDELAGAFACMIAL